MDPESIGLRIHTYSQVSGAPEPIVHYAVLRSVGFIHRQAGLSCPLRDSQAQVHSNWCTCSILGATTVPSRPIHLSFMAPPRARARWGIVRVRTIASSHPSYGRLRCLYSLYPQSSSWWLLVAQIRTNATHQNFSVYLCILRQDPD